MTTHTAADHGRKWTSWLPLSVFTLGAGLYAAVQLSDPDLGWHLAGGRLVMERGIPSVNTFSFTYPDFPWYYTQWLFSTCLYLLQRLGGYGAVELFLVLMVAAAFALTLDTICRRSGSLHWLPLAPLLLLALSASRFRFVPRPHLVTYLGLALLLNLWQRRVKRLPLWFGLVAVVWGNCHAGVVFGLALVVFMAAASALARDWPAARRASLAAVAFIAGSLMNPSGLYPYAYSLAHLEINKVLALEEFRRPRPKVETTTFFFFALALAAVPIRLKQRDFLFPLSLAAFAFLAWDSVRIIPKFLLVVLPGLGVTAQKFWVRGLDRGRKGWPVYVALAAISLASIFLAVRDYRDQRIILPWGWGLNRLFVPEGAVRFILGRDLKGNMYNDFGHGGYLAWRLYPGRRVFQDGRVQAYPAEFFRELQGSMNRYAWPQFMDKYKLDYAMVKRRPYGNKMDVAPFFEIMGWPMVYLDGTSYIFVRPGSQAQARTAQDAFRLIGPRDTTEVLSEKAEAAPAAMLADLMRLDPGNLVDPSDFFRFGKAAYLAGDPRLGEAFFRAGLDILPRQSYLRINLSVALARQGRTTEAKMELERAARDGKGTPAGEAAVARLRELSR